MDTEDIENALRSRIGDKFLGVYACDQLPSTLPSCRPLLLVANTDQAKKPGEHWVAMCLDVDGRGEFFDSYGTAPQLEFSRFLSEHCRKWSSNTKQLQSLISKFCGQYVIYYCLYRSIDYTMADILKSFMHDQGVNDWLVHGVVCRAILS